jgi:serine/threonine protein kinase
MAALEHSYICQVYDANVHMGRPYYRMELIEGLSLTDYVNTTKPSFDDRLKLFSKIAEALAYAHENGVVHCDLKPANIIVKPDGSPKLIDFDFCHIGASSSTTLSQVVATIAYMDPTIWRTPLNRDVLADIYSAGLLLWSTITGKELVPGWTPHSLVTGLVEFPSERDRIAHVVLSCIQENRAARPQDIKSLLNLLGIIEWHTTLQSRLSGAVGSFSGSSPAHGFEFLFRLWEQTGYLPGSTDFDRIAMTLKDRTLSDAEKEFIFRAACEHWSVKYRSIFKGWATDDLTRLAAIVLADPDINAAGKGKIAETSPARKALDILSVTDEYGSKADSEKVARFILELLNGERLKNLFFTALDDLVRLKCFKPQNSDLRAEAARTLMRLIKVRLPNANRGALRQIGKLLEKLERCANDNEEVIDFLQDLANQPPLLDKATITLSCFESVEATDALVSILEQQRGAEAFERIALKAIGVGGRYKRPAVARYLSELPAEEIASQQLRDAMQQLLLSS